MAKTSEIKKKYRPMLAGAVGGFLLMMPRGDEGEFDMKMFVTRFRAHSFIADAKLGEVEEVPWTKLSSYMRLLPR